MAQESQQMANLAETLAKEMKQPVELDNFGQEPRRYAIPPGWTMVEKDDEKYGYSPLRKTAKVALLDADSFIDYMRRHGAESDCTTIWCDANYTLGKVEFLGLLNDHGEKQREPGWRDHRAIFTPKHSEEWARWTGMHKKQFSQVEFAEFIESNLKDITSVDGSPTGAMILEMAVQFEANQDMRFKSAVRLQNGGVQMSFVQDDDAQTLQKMQVFDRFSVGIPVFWNGDAYRVDARLRYRVTDGKLRFWYELNRTDKTLEAAATTLVTLIREKTGSPFFFGNPFA